MKEIQFVITEDQREINKGGNFNIIGRMNYSTHGLILTLQGNEDQLLEYISFINSAGINLH